MSGISLLDAGLVLLALGMLVSFVGAVMMLVAGFIVHVGWGLAMLFFPSLAQLAFILTNWEAARRPFLTGLLGLVLAGGGLILSFQTLRSGVPAHGIVAGYVVPHLERFRQPYVELEDDPFAFVPALANGAEAETFVGRTLDELVLRFGFPPKRLILPGQNLVVYGYKDWEFEANTNGVIFSETRLEED